VKRIGDKLQQAETVRRYRQYHWCRRPNGFSDMPVWRVVAAQAKLPLYQVLALVNRLEELANNAANFGDERGSVASFDADEFGAALGMPVDEAARIFAALEHEKVRWIEERTLRTFHDRNPDREEDKEDVRNRKRRSRSRQRVRDCLVRLSRTGRIGEQERLSIELTLKGLADGGLVALQLRLAQMELGKMELEKPDNVTRSQRDQSDVVTVTPDQTSESEQKQRRDVMPLGASLTSLGVSLTPLGASLTPIAPEALVDRDKALQWLKGDAEALVAYRLGGLRHKACQQIERWSQTLCNDSAGLAQAIHAALTTSARGDAFRELVTTQVARRAAEIIAPALPLPPVPIGKG
jgi:hypothetical protein